MHRHLGRLARRGATAGDAMGLLLVAIARKLPIWAWRSAAWKLILPLVVRHADLEELRPIVDLVNRATTGAPDARLARGLLVAVHDTPVARERIAAPGASRAMRRAVASRLARTGRPHLAWHVSADLDGRGAESIARQIVRSVDDAALLAEIERFASGRGRRWRPVVGTALLRRGRLALEAGDAAEAVRLSERAATVHPGPASVLRGWALLLLGRTVAAHAAAEQAAGMVAGDEVELLRAAVAEADGAADAAVAAWEQVVADEAASVPALFGAWDGLRRCGALGLQLRAAERLVERLDGRADARARLAVSRWDRGEHDRADASLEDLYDRIDAGSVRAVAFHLGRTGRSAQAYEHLGRLSILVRGAAACTEIVAALHADGHDRVAAQARARAAVVFPEHRVLEADQHQATAAFMAGRSPAPTAT